MATEVKPNYADWQASGWDWYVEVQLRRRCDPVYLDQERYLKDLFEGMAAEFARQHGRPLRVLEFGCGFGRHLRNLHLIEGVEVHGCDQSPAMLSVAELRLARFPELKERIKLVEPTGPLPYEDDAFDVVYTVSVLIHVAPEDVQGRVAELRRVARGQVLNLELPPFPYSYQWDTAHEGCWMHNLVQAHHEAGPCRVEVDCDVLAPRVAVYRVDRQDEPGGTRLLFEGEWHEEPEAMRRAMVEAVLRYAKYCQTWVQDKFSRQLSTGREIVKTNAELRAEVRDLQRQLRQMQVLRRQLNALRRTRAVRFSHYLAEHRWLRWPLKAAFDLVSGARRLVLSFLGLRREGPLPPGEPAEEEPEAVETPEADGRDGGWRGERGY